MAGVSVGPHLVCRWRHGPCGTLTINFVRPIVKLEEIFSSEQRTQRDIDIGASLAPVIFVSLSRETRAVTCDESVTSYGPAWARTVRSLEYFIHCSCHIYWNYLSLVGLSLNDLMKASKALFLLILTLVPGGHWRHVTRESLGG